MTPTRRSFLRTAAAGLATPLVIPSGVLARPGRPGANDRIVVAAIGVGRRCQQLLDEVQHSEDATIAVLCDVYRPRAEQMAKKYKGEPATEYRKVLERKDIDAVITATVDHWRALTTIHACQAGKDVYAEKPLSLTIVEGRRMVEAARKYDRVVQTGSQQRSDSTNRFGCELIRNGRLGPLKEVIAHNYPSPWECALPGQPVLEGLDWETWCGPTPLVPFHIDLFTPRAKPGWISFRPYSGGEMTGWGAHGLDQVQWALGMDDTGPTEVWTEGPAFNPPTFREPTAQAVGDNLCDKPTVYFRYANGLKLTLGHSNPGGAIFIGEKGTLEIDRSKLTADPEEILKEAIRPDEIHLEASHGHMRNWLDCIRSRNRPIADVEIGHRSTTVCHLGNIARWTGRHLRWDPVAETFPDDPEACKLLDRERRAGYELPDSV
jgi:predicted dehydrogenase